jgi:hypothetical protein
LTPRRVVKPGIGVDDFELGMTRPELWALTESTVQSGFTAGVPDRIDLFLALAIRAEYWEGVARMFWVHTRMFDPSRTLAPIIVLGEDVSAFVRADVVALLALHGLATKEDLEQIHVPSLGLEFGFREDHGQPQQLEYLVVAAIAG